MAINLTTLFHFSGTSGYQPVGGLLEASNGKLYGVTTFGGTNNLGIIYEYNKLNNNFSSEIKDNIHHCDSFTFNIFTFWVP